MDGANLGQVACRTTWIRVELDALKANQNVEKITQVDPGDFTRGRKSTLQQARSFSDGTILAMIATITRQVNHQT